MDGDMHLFILEGMRERAVMSLWDSLPRPENTGIRLWIVLVYIYLQEELLLDIIYAFCYSFCTESLCFKVVGVIKGNTFDLTLFVQKRSMI